ncbi:MAG TPA: hypothetical protein VL098_12760 [Flavipsychrobacter sp.]|nr:hypothetical protein [Flavipsychrobacter sp.]
MPSSSNEREVCNRVKKYEQQLDDVMMLMDKNDLKIKLLQVEKEYSNNPSEVNKVRLGIIFHEVAFNLYFISKTRYNGFAKRSFDILSALFNSSKTSQGLLPFISSYRASALSLVGAPKRLKLWNEVFSLFNDAVKKYSSVSYLPEFLRGHASENLPCFFFVRKKYSKQDFQSIIDKQSENRAYANSRIMSWVYYKWSKQRQGKKYRSQVLAYLDKAISSDPDYKAGRANAENLKEVLVKKT